MHYCFFGHRIVPNEVEGLLYRIVGRILDEDPCPVFYVGNEGGFDKMTQRVLRERTTACRLASASVVLAYLPGRSAVVEPLDTIYPEGLECVPKRYAIVRRNRWMVEHSDVVITYVCHGGGAAQCKELAKKRGIAVWELNEEL